MTEEVSWRPFKSFELQSVDLVDSKARFHVTLEIQGLLLSQKHTAKAFIVVFWTKPSYCKVQGIVDSKGSLKLQAAWRKQKAKLLSET